MKTPRWFPYAGMVAFYITLIVLGRIWIEPIMTERLDSDRAETMRRWAVINERVVAANEQLRQLTLRDSLTHAVSLTPGLYIEGLSDTVTVTVLRARAEPAKQNASLRALAIREAGPAPRAAVHLVAVPIGYGTHPEVREGMWRRVFIAGVAARDQPYCIVAIGRRGDGVLQKHEMSLLTGQGVLGECAFWSRYGKPGAQIQKWLVAGGSHFAGSDMAVESWNAVMVRLPEYLSGRRSRYALPLAGQACLAGREDVCARAIARPDVLYGETDSIVRVSEWSTRLAPVERLLLIKLERDFGAERFERFWTSAEPVEAAFRTAFGVELGAWARKSIEAYGPISRGARLGGTSIVLTALFLGICAGVALATAQRRRL